MSLVLAIKNHNTIVLGADIAVPHTTTSGYGPCIQLPNRTVLLIAGNLEAARDVVMRIVIPKLNASAGAAVVAQILHAALILELLPQLPDIKGRIEFIVAGIDPVRHTEQPGLYYLDSAQGFNLMLAPGDAIAAGATAAVSHILAGHSFAASPAGQLQVLVKECLSATKLRWPQALEAHMRLGVITTQNVRFQDF